MRCFIESLLVCYLARVVDSLALIYAIFFTGYLADNRMVLTRTALEKISKNYLILLFTENNNKPNITIIEVANKLAKVCETLERMGSQQAASKTVNDSIYK